MKSLIPLFCLLIAAGRLLAADALSDSGADTVNADELMALMEFVGSWEQSDGEWVDAMSLDPPAPEQKDSGEDHDEE